MTIENYFQLITDAETLYRLWRSGGGDKELVAGGLQRHLGQPLYADCRSVLKMASNEEYYVARFRDGDEIHKFGFCAKHGGGLWGWISTSALDRLVEIGMMIYIPSFGGGYTLTGHGQRWAAAIRHGLIVPEDSNG